MTFKEVWEKYGYEPPMNKPPGRVTGEPKRECRFYNSDVGCEILTLTWCRYRNNICNFFKKED